MFPFGVFLTLKRRPGRRLVLSPSLSYRIGFAVIFAAALFVFLFGVLFEGDASPFAPANTAPLLFVLASGLALLYNDSWIFDRTRGVVENQFGLLLICRRRRFPLLELRGVSVESFRKGHAGGAMGAPGRDPGEAHRRGVFGRIDRLVARDAQGVVHVLDTARGTHAAALERTGKRIAELCGVPFEAGQ